MLQPLVVNPGTVRPAHVPIAEQTRDGLVESVHYGSVIALAPDGGTIFWAGDPMALFYPRSSLKPLQAVAMVRAGLRLPAELLALSAASHSGSLMHVEGARRILDLHGLDEESLENTPDLPYGRVESGEWLRRGGTATRLAQNCSGKHAAMVATCVVNGWPVRGYMERSHPLQQAIAGVVAELTGGELPVVSTDGCGTPLFAVPLGGMARAFGLIASAAPGSAEAAVADAMRAHPEQVAGEGRDVTALMRRVPGLLAKDGFEGLQLIGLPDGRSLAIKIADGADRARLPVTLHALELMGLDGGTLASLQPDPVLGGGLPVGQLRAVDFPR
ncbi:asparaginase [Zafaria cholistanensis]|uniref:Asparaginase n=1 Tax=Zafaria cholistanensis TaxID=1682741 RepID=A0A5A7NT31_9MICC|nr:asparaginase [Zafaria cholistanensis]GER23746.1 asparaginase [Zafaria cholistanensis]